MKPFSFVLLALATWRISNMLVHEDGPWLMFEHLRLRLGLQPEAYPGVQRETDPPGQMPGTLLNCVWCVSVWMGAFWSILHWTKPRLAEWVAMPFALSSISCLWDEWGKR